MSQSILLQTIVTILITILSPHLPTVQTSPLGALFSNILAVFFAHTELQKKFVVLRTLIAEISTGDGQSNGWSERQ